MKPLILAVLLATTLPVQAQQFTLTPQTNFTLPKTITFHANGETIGTATFSIDGRTAYFRNKNGEHYATMVNNLDGTQTLYDPSGKVIEAQSLNLPKLPE